MLLGISQRDTHPSLELLFFFSYNIANIATRKFTAVDPPEGLLKVLGWGAVPKPEGVVITDGQTANKFLHHNAG